MRMVKEDEARLDLLKFMRPHLATVIEAYKLSKEDIESVSNADSINEKINAVHEKVAKLKATVEMQAQLRLKARATRDRLTELKELAKDEEALKLLVQAYSDKAMKKIAVQAISQRLMSTVNKYARIIFPEDYQFSFNWDTSQISILVHRKYGNKVKTSDVRKLSGAESKLFTLLLVISLLSFVPSNKRSSVLILDEPTSNFSEETSEAFKSLLPILNKVIPSIVIVTPKSKEIYEGANNFTVVKESGVSRILEGHPSTLKKGKI